jgi:hypothetical protein
MTPKLSELRMLSPINVLPTSQMRFYGDRDSPKALCFSPEEFDILGWYW